VKLMSLQRRGKGDGQLQGLLFCLQEEALSMRAVKTLFVVSDTALVPALSETELASASVPLWGLPEPGARLGALCSHLISGHAQDPSEAGTSWPLFCTRGTHGWGTVIACSPKSPTELPSRSKLLQVLTLLSTTPKKKSQAFILVSPLIRIWNQTPLGGIFRDNFYQRSIRT
jgi:hypothetical protein